MTDDIALHQFTAMDNAASADPYILALEAFDAIPALQELKSLAWTRGTYGTAHNILDVGCGFGLETLRLAEKAGPDVGVHGIDLSSQFIEEAKRRAGAAGLSARFQTGDARSLPFADDHFDVVRAERVLIYLDDPAAALAEMKRVAKPGAAISLIEPDFSTTNINHPDRTLARTILTFEHDTAVAQNWLPGLLHVRLAALGFSGIEVASRILVFPQGLASGYFKGIAGRAVESGVISGKEHKDWVEGIEELEEASLLFGTVGYFLFSMSA
jgi:SAM-dependent methyltransferase